MRTCARGIQIEPYRRLKTRMRPGRSSRDGSATPKVMRPARCTIHCPELSTARPDRQRRRALCTTEESNSRLRCSGGSASNCPTAQAKVLRTAAGTPSRRLNAALSSAFAAVLPARCRRTSCSVLAASTLGTPARLANPCSLRAGLLLCLRPATGGRQVARRDGRVATVCARCAVEGEGCVGRAVVVDVDVAVALDVDIHAASG